MEWGAPEFGLPIRLVQVDVSAVFDTSVRLGQPAGLSGLADRCQGPQYAVAVGLVKWGVRTHHQHAVHANGRQGALTLTTTYQKTVRWLRDFF